jgi:hypothetical protein
MKNTNLKGQTYCYPCQSMSYVLYHSSFFILYLTTKKVALQDRWPLERASIHMKFSMTGQEKGDLSIQVTA